MLPADLLKKVRRIEIRTNRLVNESLAGEYHSVFKGRGMEFSEVREYQFGDDIRSIDWNVTSRMGHPYVKKHVEERELTVILLVDFSASGEFGTRRQFKREIEAEICAILAFSAIKNSDRVVLIAVTVTDPREEDLPPIGLLDLEDAETGARVLVDASDRRTRERFKAWAERRRVARETLFRANAIDNLELFTDRPYDVPLLRFFHKRARRMSR